MMRMTTMKRVAPIAAAAVTLSLSLGLMSLPASGSGDFAETGTARYQAPASMPTYAEYEERELGYETTAGPQILKAATLSRYSRKATTWRSRVDWREDVLEASADFGLQVGDWRAFFEGVEERVENGLASTNRVIPPGADTTYVPRREFARPYYRSLESRIARGEYENDASPRPCGDTDCGVLTGRTPMSRPTSGEYFHSLPWTSSNEEIEYLTYELDSGLIRSRRLLFNGMLISSFQLMCYSMEREATHC